MRLDPVDERHGWERDACTVELRMRAPLVYGVCVYDVVVAEYTTRREAERHAARIRKALKGER